jgi:hypothetical protein
VVSVTDLSEPIGPGVRISSKGAPADLLAALWDYFPPGLPLDLTDPAVRAVAGAVTHGLVDRVVATLLAAEPSLAAATARTLGERIVWGLALRDGGCSDQEAADRLGVRRETVVRDRKRWDRALEAAR